MSTKCEVSTAKIIQGEGTSIFTTVVQCDGKTARPLQSLVGASALFPGEDNTIIKTIAASGVVIDDACLGVLEIILTQSDTEELKVGEEQDWILHLDFGGNDKPKILYERGITVDVDTLESLLP